MYSKNAKECIKTIINNGKMPLFEVESNNGDIIVVDVYDSDRFLVAEDESTMVYHRYDKDFSTDENLQALYEKYIETSLASKR